MSEEYRQAYDRSVKRSKAFWMEAADVVSWTKPPTIAWSQEDGWFADGELNTCYNAVDRHVRAGRGDNAALVYESAYTGASESLTYAGLLEAVSKTAGMLQGLGVEKGDRVIIYMPMIPEAVFAMLACARIGAIHSVVFGGFAPPELAKRIDDAKDRKSVV